MISKKIDRGQKTSSFERLGNYVLEAKNDEAAILWTRTAEYVVDLKTDTEGDKVLWFRISHCEAEVPAMAIAEVLATQAMNTRSQADKTYHCVISFPEGERPSREQLEDIEDQMCEALGFGDHQRISAVHQDTDNIHLHLAISKVNPVTYRVHEPFRDYYTRNQVCREMELKHNLTVDNGIGEGQRLGNASKMEAHTGEQTLWGWIQDHAKEDLKIAVLSVDNWQAVHAAMQAHGLQIKPRGAGFVIGLLDGSVHIKASSVDPCLAFKALTARFGEYKPPEKAQSSKQSQTEGQNKAPYQAGPKQGDEEAKALYSDFQAAKQAVWITRNEFKTKQSQERQQFNDALKKWHQEERNRIKTASWPPKQKREAYTHLSQERQRVLEIQRKKETEQKKAVFGAHTVLSWEQYLAKAAENGNGKALTLLRSKKLKQARVAKALLTADNLEAARHIVYADLKPFARKNGEMVYKVQDGGLVTDEHTRVRVDTLTTGSAFLALTMAAERFHGQPLDVQGDQSFKNQVVQFAVQYGMDVKFKDAKLEAKRQQLRKAVKVQATTALLTPALEAFISQRNQLRETVSDILPHRIWMAQDAGEVTFQGRRNLTDGSQAVLFKRDSEMLVKPVQSEAEFQGLKVGQTIHLNAQGQKQAQSKGRSL